MEKYASQKRPYPPAATITRETYPMECDMNKSRQINMTEDEKFEQEIDNVGKMITSMLRFVHRHKVQEIQYKLVSVVRQYQMQLESQPAIGTQTNLIWSDLGSHGLVAPDFEASNSEDESEPLMLDLSVCKVQQQPPQQQAGNTTVSKTTSAIANIVNSANINSSQILDPSNTNVMYTNGGSQPSAQNPNYSSSTMPGNHGPVPINMYAHMKPNYMLKSQTKYVPYQPNTPLRYPNFSTLPIAHMDTACNLSNQPNVNTNYGMTAFTTITTPVSNQPYFSEITPSPSPIQLSQNVEATTEDNNNKTTVDTENSVPKKDTENWNIFVYSSPLFKDLPCALLIMIWVPWTQAV